MVPEVVFSRHQYISRCGDVRIVNHVDSGCPVTGEGVASGAGGRLGSRILSCRQPGFCISEDVNQAASQVHNSLINRNHAAVCTAGDCVVFGTDLAIAVEYRNAVIDAVLHRVVAYPGIGVLTETKTVVDVICAIDGGEVVLKDNGGVLAAVSRAVAVASEGAVSDDEHTAAAASDRLIAACGGDVVYDVRGERAAAANHNGLIR